jgi:hypothetical protein
LWPHVTLPMTPGSTAPPHPHAMDRLTCCYAMERAKGIEPL